MAAKLEKYTVETLPFYPVLASPKIDGIRIVIKDGKPLTRKLKPVPNRLITKQLSDHRLSGLDGEIVVGDPTNRNGFNDTQSGVMSQDGPPLRHGQVELWVFDDFTDPCLPYAVRLESASARVDRLRKTGYFDWLKVVPTVRLTGPLQLVEYEGDCVEVGYEGAMIRNPGGRYKFGRSTEREGILIKLKRFVDAEAKIIGFEELLHNANEQKRDELGRAKRSSHKANMVPMGTLGALVARSPKWELSFNIGTGYTQAQRDELWANRKKLKGKTVNFVYQAHGSKDRPRMPSFRGIRLD